MCLARSSSEHVCGCSIGYSVDPTNSTRCIGTKEFLFYTDQELKGIEIYDPLKPIAQQGQDMVSGSLISFSSLTFLTSCKDCNDNQCSCFL